MAREGKPIYLNICATFFSLRPSSPSPLSSSSAQSNFPIATVSGTQLYVFNIRTVKLFYFGFIERPFVRRGMHVACAVYSSNHRDTNDSSTCARLYTQFIFSSSCHVIFLWLLFMLYSLFLISCWNNDAKQLTEFSNHFLVRLIYTCIKLMWNVSASHIDTSHDLPQPFGWDCQVLPKFSQSISFFLSFLQWLNVFLAFEYAFLPKIECAPLVCNDLTWNQDRGLAQNGDHRKIYFLIFTGFTGRVYSFCWRKYENSINSLHAIELGCRLADPFVCNSAQKFDWYYSFVVCLAVCYGNAGCEKTCLWRTKMRPFLAEQKYFCHSVIQLLLCLGLNRCVPLTATVALRPYTSVRCIK